MKIIGGGGGGVGGGGGGGVWVGWGNSAAGVVEIPRVPPPPLPPPPLCNHYAVL